MERIEECLNFLLGKAYQKATQTSKAKLSSYGITPPQFALLHILWKTEGQSGADLGERLRLDSATVTGLLDRLEQSGLIERRTAANDRRVNLIYLTPKGKELEVPLNEKMDEMNQEIVADFTENEVKLLKEMLSKIGLRVKGRG